MSGEEAYYLAFAVGIVGAFWALLGVSRRLAEAERERLLGPLRGLFDPGSTEFRKPKFLSMGVNRRILAGRRGGRDFELWLEGPKNRRGKHGPRYDYTMALRLSTPASVSFKAGWSNWFTGLGAKLGLLQDLDIGHAQLDEMLRFSSPDADALTRLGQRESFREAVRAAVADRCFNGIEAGETGLILHRRHDNVQPLVDPEGAARAVAALESLRAALLG